MERAELSNSFQRIRETLWDKEVLARLDVFLILYFGWLGYTFLYEFIKSHSRDITSYFLRLPFTSRIFVVSTVNLTKSIPPIYYLMKGVYFIGFSGSIALTVFFILIYWRDLNSADELAARYLLSYVTCGIIYSIAHVYAPHDVYGLHITSPSATYLTQREFVLPSLHNTIAAINVMTLWKHREKIWGKVLIILNSLVPFSTLLLGHHWLYDIISGIILASVIGEITEGQRIDLQNLLHRIDVSHIQAATALGFVAGAYFLFLAMTLPKP
jgi:membrane-associated phospholipid phosphatase